MDECRRKDELLNAYREQIDLLNKLITVKNERIKNLQEYCEELLKHIHKSDEQFNAVIEIANKVLK